MFVFYHYWACVQEHKHHLHIYYLLTDTAFARHLTQLSKCLTEQMGLIWIPKGMPTLTVPRGVNAPIWHLCVFSQQRICYSLVPLQIDPFLSQRSECERIGFISSLFRFSILCQMFP